MNLIRCDRCLREITPAGTTAVTVTLPAVAGIPSTAWHIDLCAKCRERFLAECSPGNPAKERQRAYSCG